MIGSNWIVGVVGQLQLEVLISRIGAEYNVDAGFEPSPWETARWIAADDESKLKAFIEEKRSAIAEDRAGAPVFRAKDAWELNYISQLHADTRFTAPNDRPSPPLGPRPAPAFQTP